MYSEKTGTTAKERIIEQGGFPLTEDSKATCPLGTPGCIRIVFHGQIAMMNKPDFMMSKPQIIQALNPAVPVADALEDIIYVK